MITFSQSLRGSGTTPTGFGWELPFLSGRWWLTPDLDLIDTQDANRRYRRDRAVPIKDATVIVPGLGPEPLNLSYLFALAVKPIHGLDETQIRSDEGILPYFENSGLDKEPFLPEDVVWVVPDGGEVYSAGKLVIPGFSKYYYVNELNGEVCNKSDDLPVVIGTNRGRMAVLKDDQDNLVEVDVAHIALYAMGALSREDFEPIVYFVDGDSSNLEYGNVTVTPIVADLQTASVVDNTQDYVVTDGDGQPDSDNIID